MSETTRQLLHHSCREPPQQGGDDQPSTPKIHIDQSISARFASSLPVSSSAPVQSEEWAKKGRRSYLLFLADGLLLGWIGCQPRSSIATLWLDSKLARGSI